MYFYYEKVQKRCYICQRLTHARDQCPLKTRFQANVDVDANPSSSSSGQQPPGSLSEKDPLFGILSDDQVGIHPISGRPRIAPEVLQEMRIYLLAANGEDRSVKEQRIISSIKETRTCFYRCGHVDTVTFDPTKSQRHDFVRVKNHP